MAEKYYIGLDGGSTYIKAALLRENEVLDTRICSTGIANNEAAARLVDEILRNNQLTGRDIGSIMATGYSRKVLDLADDDISEITAHAWGVRITAPEGYRPGMIVDIGGQDSKIIYLDPNYGVKNFAMNDKCAAGTGRFLEVVAQTLETTIDQIGPISLESREPCDINSTCVVFAQSEIISLVARKYDRKDILAGMHLSLVKVLEEGPVRSTLRVKYRYGQSCAIQDFSLYRELDFVQVRVRVDWREPCTQLKIKL